MTFLQAIGLVGGLASMAGLVYAIYYARQNRKIKLFVFDRSPAMSLARVVSPEENYSISLTFAQKGEPEQKIESVYVSFLRFANLGKDPIRRQDIAPANRLRLEVEGAKTLDIAVTGVSREVCNIELGNISRGGLISSADVLFDFLDHNDGAVLKVLTENRPKWVKLCGDIIGMPDGIRRSDKVRSLGVVNTIGAILSILFYIAAFVLTPFTYRWITGSWTHVWVLILPFIALMVPPIIIFFVGGMIWPSKELRLPKGLILPPWFDRLMHRTPYPSFSFEEMDRMSRRLEESLNKRMANNALESTRNKRASQC
jgi:hypothetical protein